MADTGGHPYASPLITQDQTAIQRKNTTSSASFDEKRNRVKDAEDVMSNDKEEDETTTFYQRFRPFILGAVAMVILGWWISSIVLKATRHRW